MVRFWALAVIALTTLGVVVQVFADEGTAHKDELASNEPVIGRVYHVDE